MTKRTIHVEIPDDVWRTAKLRTVAEGTTLTAVVTEALIAYAEKPQEES